MFAFLNITINMPIYRYKHPKSGKVVEIIQKMTDRHEYCDENGTQYERVFENPNLSKDTIINPFSKNDFINKAHDKKMNVGEMWDLSKDLSNKRKQIDGKDKIKQNYNKQKYESRINHIKKNTSKKISH